MRTITRRINLVTMLISLLVIVSLVSRATWGTTIYVDDDNIAGPWDGTIQHPYQHIQDGVNHSSSGDTIFVFKGFYYGNVLVDKPVVLAGEKKDSTFIDANRDSCVVTILVDGVNISEFTIQNSGSEDYDAGILGSGYFHGNIITNNYRGIRAGSSTKIVGNTISSNAWTGLRLEDGSSNDSIYGNIISNNGFDGISLLDGCNNNNIFGNIITNNMWNGVGLGGSLSTNIISENIIANNGSYGIYPRAGANNNLFSRNTITNNWGGVRIESAWGNIVSENMIADNYYGIEMDCGPNTYSGNTIKNSEIGIFVWGLRNTITANTITNCTQAIRLRHAGYAKLVGNSIIDNWLGLNLDITYEDTIFSNTIANNTHLGVGVGRSSNNNLLYHNNFLNNAQNSEDLGTNVWNNDYPSGGNYWSDYTGVDADSDGIGDTPYNIPGGSNQDRYPLVYIRGDANRNMIIDIADVLFLINFVCKNGPAPNFLPSGDANSDGVIDILDVYYLINYLFLSGPAPCK